MASFKPGLAANPLPPPAAIENTGDVLEDVIGTDAPRVPPGRGKAGRRKQPVLYTDPADLAARINGFRTVPKSSFWEGLLGNYSNDFLRETFALLNPLPQAAFQKYLTKNQLSL